MTWIGRASLGSWWCLARGRCSGRESRPLILLETCICRRADLAVPVMHFYPGTRCILSLASTGVGLVFVQSATRHRITTGNHSKPAATDA